MIKLRLDNSKRIERCMVDLAECDSCFEKHRTLHGLHVSYIENSEYIDEDRKNIIYVLVKCPYAERRLIFAAFSIWV